MRFFKALIKDIKINTSSTYLKVALLAVTLVPLLYGALYLKAFWDPYAKIDNIPVAVVNLDSGNNNNPKSNIGNELVEKLKKNDNLKWNFVSETEANNGLNSKKYYASITIPADFSKKYIRSTVTAPKKPQLSINRVNRLIISPRPSLVVFQTKLQTVYLVKLYQNTLIIFS